MTLEEAIAEVRRVTPKGVGWTELDFPVEDPQDDHPAIDKHIATILNAAASGELIPLAKVQAALSDLDHSLCNFCNSAGDPWEPVDEWRAEVDEAFKHLCQAYNRAHQNGIMHWNAKSGDLIPLADHKLAVALAYQRAAAYSDKRQDHDIAAGILALADTDALAEAQALRKQVATADKLAEALRSKTVMDPGNSNSTWLDAQARAALSAYEATKGEKP